MQISHENMLKEHKLSLTSRRLAVLEVLQKHPHSDAAIVFEIVHKKIKMTSKQAIYNNLSVQLERGIIREIKPKRHPSFYETRVVDNHHHIVCKTCHIVMDTDYHAFAPCRSPINKHVFVIDEAEVTFGGISPSCQNYQQTQKEKK